MGLMLRLMKTFGALAIIALTLLACSSPNEHPLSPPEITNVELTGSGEVTVEGNYFFEQLTGERISVPPVVTVCGEPVHGARISGEDAFILSPPGQSLRLRVGSAITGTLAASAALSGSDVVVVLPDGRSATLENASVCAPVSAPAPEPTPDLTIDAFDTDALDPTDVAKVFRWEITYTGDDELTCEFDPGDGTAAFDFVPCELVWSTSFIFNDPGNYTATLTVTDEAGVGATKSIDFEIFQYTPAPM